MISPIDGASGRRWAILPHNTTSPLCAEVRAVNNDGDSLIATSKCEGGVIAVTLIPLINGWGNLIKGEAIEQNVAMAFFIKFSWGAVVATIVVEVPGINAFISPNDVEVATRRHCANALWLMGSRMGVVSTTTFATTSAQGELTNACVSIPIWKPIAVIVALLTEVKSLEDRDNWLTHWNPEGADTNTGEDENSTLSFLSSKW